MVESSAALDLVFRALADPTRRAMLDRLSRRSRAVGELAEPFDVSLNAISKHLKVLESAGLVKRTWEGRVARCELRAEGLMPAERWLEHYRQFWTSRLDALESLFAAERAKKGKKR